MQLLGLLSIVGGVGLGFVQYYDTPVTSSPDWSLVALYPLSGLLGSIIPFGLAEVLRRVEDIQSNLAVLREHKGSGTTIPTSKGR